MTLAPKLLVAVGVVGGILIVGLPFGIGFGFRKYFKAKKQQG